MITRLRTRNDLAVLFCFWANQMRQYHSCDQCRLTVLSGNAEVCTADAMRVIIDIQNKLLLTLYQLTNLRAFWDFATLLNKCANLFAACHHIHLIVDFSEIWLFT